MPQIYEAELSDGRIVEFESDHEPTHDEILRALSTQPQEAVTLPQKPNPKFMSPATPPKPDTTWMLPGGLGPTPKFTTPIGGSRPISTLSDVQEQPFYNRGLIDPSMVPSGAGTSMPGLTIPLSAVGKAAAGVGGFLTSPRGITETALAATPLAPAILGKWAVDMIKGGYESAKDAVDTVASMARDAYSKGIIKQNQLGPMPPGTTTEDHLQRLAEDAVNVAMLTAGGISVAGHIPKSIRSNLLPKAAAEVQKTTEKGAPDASSIEEAAEVYGDVRPQPGKSQGQMPLEEGGKGIQPQTGRRVEKEAQVLLNPEDYSPESFESGSVTLTQAGKLLPDGSIMYARDHAAEPMALAPGVDGFLVIPKNFEARGLDPMELELGERTFTPKEQEQFGIRFVSIAEADAAKGDLGIAIRKKYKPKQVQPVLSPDEQAYLDAERQGMDVDVQVTPTLPGDQPFAGQIATIDRTNNRILVNPQEFSGWLAKVAEKDRAKAVKSLLSEERLHLAADDASALGYWNTLTAFEKLAQRRRYTGNWQGIDPTTGQALPDVLMGHEALRFRLQQLARITPREIAETNWLSREGFTVRSITALEGAVRAVRETLGTKASSEALAILDRVQGNLDAARAVLAGGQEPAALRKGKPARESKEIEAELSKVYPNWRERFGMEGENELPSKVQALFEELRQADWQALKSEKPVEFTDEGAPTGFGGRSLRAVGEPPSLPGEQAFPAALRKKQLQDTKQENLILPPVAETAGLERSIPTGPTAFELERIAQRHVDEAFAKGKVPDFEAFRNDVGLKPDKLFYLWQDALLRKLPTLKGKEVENYVSELGLVRDIAEGLKPGEKEPRIGGPIADPQVFTRGQQIVMPTLGKVSKAQYARQMAPEQRRRHAAIAGIFDKLMQKAGPKPEKPWTRTTIGPEDIQQTYSVTGAPTKGMVEQVGVEGVEPPVISSKPMYRRFLPEEAKDPAIVAKLATTGAAIDASGKGAPPRTVSRNVVALKERSSGKVVLVNAFRDPRSGPKVTNPTAANLEAQNISAALLEKYQPVAVMSLRDPIKNFRQVFDSLEAFHKEFGDVAMEGTPGLRTSSFAGPERGIVEGQAGLSRPTSAPRPETLENVLARDIEAPVSPTARELTKRERLAPTVVRGETLPKEPGPEPKLPAPKEPEMLPGPLPNYQQFEAETIFKPAKPTGEVKEFGKPEKLQPGYLLREAGTEKGKFYARGPASGALAQYYPSRQRYPAALIKPAKDAVKKTIVNAVVDPLRVYSEWMSERIARVGGPVSKAFSDAANIIIDREKEIYGTELTPTLDIARRAAGKLGKASTWANKVKPITDKAGISNAVESVEGRLAAPTYARPLIDLTKAANLEIGKVHQRGSPTFVATGKWERHLTAVGYDIMRSGDTPLRQAWEDGLAKINYNPHGTTTLADWKSRAHDFFVKWKAILDEPAPDMATIEKVNQDFHRYFPKAVTHLKINGLWQPVIHGKIYDYLEAAARRASHVAAFRESFPLKSRNAFNNMLKDVRAELPADVQQDLDGLIRAMNGHPTDTYSSSPILGPGKFWGESFSFLNNTLGNLFAKLVLSNQLFVQPGENIAGSTPVFLGYKNYLRAAAELTSQPNHVLKMMEQEGAINRAMYDFSYDPSSPVRSAFRITGNAISRTFFEQWLNEVQEVHAATTAAVVSERIKNNQLDTWEKRMLPQTFKMMGFDPGQVVELMRGNPDLLGQFERKAAAFLTSGNKAIAEGSSIAGNRMFNSIFRFQTYPMMKMNQFRKVTGNFVEAWSKGTGAEKAKATEMFTRFMLGNTVQGILTVALTTYAAQNIAGLAIRAHEAKDNPWHFMFDAFLATTGGPAYLLWRGATDQGVAGIPEQLQRMIFPMGVATELINFAEGTGPYRDKSASERIKKFLEQKLPGTRALKQGLAVAGLSKTDVELDSSIAAFYRWRRDALGYTTYEPFLKDKTRSDFRMHMRRAVDKIKQGDIDGYVEAVAKAEELVGEKEVKASLGSRRILQTPTGKELSPEELDQLTTHIGQRAVDKLMEFDAMLAELAK